MALILTDALGGHPREEAEPGDKADLGSHSSMALIQTDTLSLMSADTPLGRQSPETWLNSEVNPPEAMISTDTVLMNLADILHPFRLGPVSGPGLRARSLGEGCRRLPPPAPLAASA
eukprot:3486060-Amphidinium_carterae.1